MIGDWIYDNMGKIIVAMGILIIVGMGFVISASIKDQKEWEVYAKRHHCVAVGIKRGQTATGVSMDGKATLVTTTTPDQTIYTCDGGEMQIR